MLRSTATWDNKMFEKRKWMVLCLSVFLYALWQVRGGGTDLERGYGDVRPWRPPFHASPAARKGPISSKRVSSQDPLLRKFGNFSLNSLNFCPSFSSQASKFGNFPLTSPPFSEANVSSQAPHFGNPGRTPLPEKKLSAPPPGWQVPLFLHRELYGLDNNKIALGMYFVLL